MDYIVCYFENLVESITEFIGNVEKFGQVSGYKISVSKSICSGFHISHSTKLVISKVMSVKWQEYNVRYLGVQLCRTNDQMVRGNIQLTWKKDASCGMRINYRGLVELRL